MAISHQELLHFPRVGGKRTTRPACESYGESLERVRLHSPAGPGFLSAPQGHLIHPCEPLPGPSPRQHTPTPGNRCWLLENLDPKEQCPILVQEPHPLFTRSWFLPREHPSVCRFSNSAISHLAWLNLLVLLSCHWCYGQLGHWSPCPKLLPEWKGKYQWRGRKKGEKEGKERKDREGDGGKQRRGTERTVIFPGDREVTKNI